MEDERDLVDGVDVLGRDHRILFDVAEQRDLRLDARGEIAVGAAQEDVGLNSDGPQLFH